MPDLNDKIIDITEKSNREIPHVWRNMNIFYKKPTYVGYTPYLFKSVSLAEESGNYLPALNNPMVFLADELNTKNIIDTNSYDNLSGRKISALSFSPNSIEVKINTALTNGLSNNCYDNPGV